MKTKHELPPNYAAISKVLGDVSQAFFCYADTIYIPKDKELTPDLLVHEKTHSLEQGDSPELWWEKYLTNPDFRLKEEVKAYGEQYLFVKEHVGNKLSKWALQNMAEALSGKLYGNLVEYHKAHSLIRHYQSDEPVYKLLQEEQRNNEVSS